MANCNFPAGLAQVSGTLSKTTIMTAQGPVTRSVIAQVRNGKQKIYFRESKPRRTKPTAKETAQRQLFGFCSSVSSMIISKYHLGSAPKVKSFVYQAVKKRYLLCAQQGIKPSHDFIVADIEAYAQINPQDRPIIVYQKIKAYAQVQ